jgi:hypothetical protein
MFDVVSVLILSVVLFGAPEPPPNSDQPACTAPVFADADGAVDFAPCIPPESKPAPSPSRQPWKPA